LYDGFNYFRNMKTHYFTRVCIVAMSLIIVSCNPDEEDNPSSNNGGNNNGGGNTTSGSPHSCGAANVHNPDLTYGSMTDQEGNSYKTIVIGTQEWMAENLNTSIYRNGDAIPTGLSSAEWQSTWSTQQGAWAYHDNDVSYACPYGKLYNWYACVDPRGLCPTGWHVPSDAEWSAMINYLDPSADATVFVEDVGRAMKSSGTIEGGDGYWNGFNASPSAEGTNSSGFSGLPSGYRADGYILFGQHGYWWSSTQGYNGAAWCRRLDALNDGLSVNTSLTYFGLSVRCLRD
jgi:uncharacterized protein (TIGR02145 family)